ncbi:MAG: hypothetical protein SPI64_08590 [Anaerovibrio sp.]|nr:hypothetical protein [Selenomonadaceae bacterium]MDD6397352.1 hypothetical protein [Selenomonadaceae bacterium]MDY6054162.1 hypothetical protein [Anaerovibrio sp.]
MRLQRTGVAESPAECSTLNGSLRVRSKRKWYLPELLQQAFDMASWLYLS